MILSGYHVHVLTALHGQLCCKLHELINIYLLNAGNQIVFFRVGTLSKIEKSNLNFELFERPKIFKGQLLKSQPSLHVSVASLKQLGR